MKNQTHNPIENTSTTSRSTFSGKRNDFDSEHSYGSSPLSSDSLPVEDNSRVFSESESDSKSSPSASAWYKEKDDDDDDDDEDDEDNDDDNASSQLSRKINTSTFSRRPYGARSSIIPSSSRFTSEKKASKRYKHNTGQKSTSNSYSDLENSDLNNPFLAENFNGMEIEDLNDLAVIQSAYSHSDHLKPEDQLDNSFDSKEIASLITSNPNSTFKPTSPDNNQDLLGDSDRNTEVDENSDSIGSGAIVSSSYDNTTSGDSDSEDSDDFYSSDSDASSAFGHPLTHKREKKKPKKLQPPQKLMIPKRLDPSTFRISNVANQNDSLLFDDDDDGISDLSVMSESELDALEASIPQFRRRRDSVVDKNLDENTAFPRSKISGAIEEEPLDYKESATSDNDSDEFNEEDGNRLMAMLNSDFESSTAEAGELSSDDSISDDDDDDDDDDDLGVVDFDDDEITHRSHNGDHSQIFEQDDEADNDAAIEAAEERALLEEIERSGDLENPSSAMLMGYESEDDAFDSDLSFENDFFFTRPAQKVAPEEKVSKARGDNSEDDDSYLWSYFFTSDEESSSDDGNVQQSTNGPITSSFVDAELYNNDISDDSGESTDEDENLPFRNNGKPASKPTEILSSSTAATRPPVLGSWVMSTERPFGIIDGRTTRSLGSVDTIGLDSRKRSFNEIDFSGTSSLKTGSKASAGTLGKDESKDLSTAESMSNAPTLVNTDTNSNILTGESLRAAKTKHTDDDSESDLSELALDDFINTSELDDEEEDTAKETANEHASTYDFYGRLTNRDIPLSAFRNRGLSAYSFQPNAYISTLSHRGRHKSHGHRNRRSSSVSTALNGGLSRRGSLASNSSSMIGQKSRTNSTVGNNHDLMTADDSTGNFFSGLVLPSTTSTINDESAPSSRGGTPGIADQRSSTSDTKDLSYDHVADPKSKRSKTISDLTSTFGSNTGGNSNNMKLRKKKRKHNGRNKLLDGTYTSDTRNGGTLDIGSLGDLTIDVELLDGDFIVDDISGMGALSPLFGGIM